MVRRVRVMPVAVVVVAALLLLAASPALAAHRPTRVMIVVMDQMQPGYAKQFDMKNVLWLQNNGVNFPNAYVGDMASETVVSHNVMVSGLFPKHMGWSDEAFRDVDNLLGYGENAIVTTGDLGTTPTTSSSSRTWAIPSWATTCTPSSPARRSPAWARSPTRSSRWPPPARTTMCGSAPSHEHRRTRASFRGPASTAPGMASSRVGRPTSP